MPPTLPPLGDGIDFNGPPALMVMGPPQNPPTATHLLVNGQKSEDPFDCEYGFITKGMQATEMIGHALRWESVFMKRQFAPFPYHYYHYHPKPWSRSTTGTRLILMKVIKPVLCGWETLISSSQKLWKSDRVICSNSNLCGISLGQTHNERHPLLFCCSPSNDTARRRGNEANFTHFEFMVF